MKIIPKQKISDKVKAILKMRKKNKSIVEIASFFNLSKQRIFSILKRYGDPLDLPKYKRTS